MPESKNRRSTRKGNRRKKSHETARYLGIPTHPVPRRKQNTMPDVDTLARFIGTTSNPA